MNSSSIIISILALIFAVYSFWWMNWRKGKLKVSYLKHYGVDNSANKLLIELPLVFFNIGALPVVVESLRLILLDKNSKQIFLHFNAIRTELMKDEGRYFATPFSINRGDSKKLVCEFQKNPSEFSFEIGDYKLLLEGKLYSKNKWIVLRKFIITIPQNKLESLRTKYEILEELK